MADETEENPFATHLELAKRWKQMPDDPDYVDQRLADASQFIREQCPDWRNISRATLERIACELAKDVISSDMQTEGAGFDTTGASKSQSHGGQFHPVDDLLESSRRILSVQGTEEGAWAHRPTLLQHRPVERGGVMRGETVTVVRYTPTGETDPGGSPVTKDDIESVGNVLVSPGAMSNATDSLRPDGVTVAFTCLFPRSYAYRSLRGASIRIDEHDYKVIGDPRPLDGGMKPTAWNLTIEVTDTKG